MPSNYSDAAYQQEHKMDNSEEPYGQRDPTLDRSYGYKIEGTLLPRREAYGMADIDVKESTLRGLDVVSAGVAAIMMLGPLAAVAIGMS